MVQISIEKRGMVTINIFYQRWQYFESKNYLGGTLNFRDYNAQISET
ncbi:hypothetical protein BTN50_1916 [Candidatus Enterovibrio altilux]|uniref:Uncharacterized protein n=1 Tax=Candidatus Enterovibrio altilux TaxID=1927128 RepID=A0A291BBE8_9GAMM|nr:hypothetical protein BTN50_1916 [Candidatus Enterovibrio luxaltus]